MLMYMEKKNAWKESDREASSYVSGYAALEKRFTNPMAEEWAFIRRGGYPGVTGTISGLVLRIRPEGNR